MLKSLDTRKQRAFRCHMCIWQLPLMLPPDTPRDSIPPWRPTNTCPLRFVFPLREKCVSKRGRNPRPSPPSQTLGIHWLWCHSIDTSSDLIGVSPHLDFEWAIAVEFSVEIALEAQVCCRLCYLLFFESLSIMLLLRVLDAFVWRILLATMICSYWCFF